MSVRRILPMALAATLLAFAACGGTPSDNPSDCTEGEYYNEATELCTSCPTVVDPGCTPGCGFRIVEDDRGCPQAECAVDCDLCASDEYFSEPDLTCRPCEASPNPPEICPSDPM
jgi:anaerobic selenocysteine-containing dehydrogenase